MAYQKNTWASGDVVTSAKLNNIENGIAGGGVLVVGMDENGTLDHTWQQIHDAVFSVVIHDKSEENFEQRGFEAVMYAEIYTEGGQTAYVISTSNNAYTASSADGYPVHS